MAFFKFRKGGDQSPAARRPVESIEAMRTRARHRLIGAGVLVLAAVAGFPLLFDTQPRPIAVDIPIEIPRKDPYACELEDFAAAARRERPHPFGREDAVGQARAIAALYRSAEFGAEAVP